jgi:hypothetical protein
LRESSTGSAATCVVWYSLIDSPILNDTARLKHSRQELLSSTVRIDGVISTHHRFISDRRSAWIGFHGASQAQPTIIGGGPRTRAQRRNGVRTLQPPAFRVGYRVAPVEWDRQHCLVVLTGSLVRSTACSLRFSTKSIRSCRRCRLRLRGRLPSQRLAKSCLLRFVE